MAVNELGITIPDKKAETALGGVADTGGAYEAPASSTVEPTVAQPVAPVQTAALSGPTASTPYSQLADERKASTGTDYAGYEKTKDTPTAQESSKYITPETTVLGQLDKILGSDSALLKREKQKARETASELNMLSSTAGIGATRGAVMDRALQIATPDALSAGKFGLQQQAIQNEQTKIETEANVAGDLTVQKAKISEAQKKVDDEWALRLKGVDADTAENMENLRGEWNTSFKELDGALTRELQQLEIDANIEQTIMNQSHDAMNNAQISVQQLMGNQSFLDSMPDSATMNGVFNGYVQGALSSIRFNAKAAGVYDTAFEDMLDDMYEDAEYGS